MSTWRELIQAAAEGDKIIACTIPNEKLDEEFGGYLGFGRPFTAWSEKYVYFPVVYDGAEWVGRAPRNPCDEATNHVGGE